MEKVCVAFYPIHDDVRQRKEPSLSYLLERDQFLICNSGLLVRSSGEVLFSP